MNIIKILAFVAGTLSFANSGLSLPAHAEQLANDRSIGNIQVQASDNGRIDLQTPSINISKPAVGRVSTIQYYRRCRASVGRRRGVISAPAIVNQQLVGKVTPVEYPENSNNSANESHSISRQYVQCHRSGSSISQSSQTTNGRTVSSKVYTNCN